MRKYRLFDTQFFKLKIFLVTLLLIISISSFLILRDTNKEYLVSPYPSGLNFAFTITDDPDSGTLEKIKPVYDYLSDVGLRTTVAVFIFKANRTNGEPDRTSKYSPGDSCERQDYLKYIKELQKRGFEIAIHGASWGNDKRGRTIKGYESFFNYFGKYPKIYINHKQNLENVYWGSKVAPDPITEKLLKTALPKARINYSGEIETSDYFWGDILKEKTKYVRMFGTENINTLSFNPSMPYHDTKKPYVNYWFSFSNGNGVNGFTKLLSEKNIDKLVKQRGSCILYTHFGHNFSEKGVINEKVKKSIDMVVSKKQGWFVTASELLDRLLAIKNLRVISDDRFCLILNLNDIKVDKVTLLSKDRRDIYDLNGKRYKINDENEIIIGDIEKFSGKIFLKDKQYLNEITNGISVIKIGESAIYIKKTKDWQSNFNNKITVNEFYDCSGNFIQSEPIKYAKKKFLQKDDKKEIFLITDQNLFKKENFLIGKLELYKLLFHRAITYVNNN